MPQTSTGHVMLAIDQGTTNSKALLISADGRLISGGSAPLGVSTPRPGWVEQDAERIWTSVLEAMAACLEGAPDAEIVGIALSTQRESVVGWRASTGAPIGPVIGWQDRRTTTWCNDSFNNHDRRLIHDRSGLRVDPMFSAPKMRWILDHLPAGVSIDAVRLGTVDSWLIWRLTDGAEYLCEAGNASRTLLYDVTKLACSTASGANTDSCLTPAEMKTVNTFYNGVKNSKGELIFSGQQITNPLPALQPPTGLPGGGYDTVRIWGFQNADYDWKPFDLDRDMPIINSKVGFVDAVDADLSKFKAHGGKLLLYAGWGDTTITPENTVLYYENLQSKMGKNQDDWTRLFMVPGMGHCRGGDGPYAFDLIGTMEAWREKGVAPARITAFNPQSGLSRPLCPYPQHAKYTGTGNFKDASNWVCTAP